jgi:hypothetical protein
VKRFRKILAVTLAALMTAALLIPAFAAEPEEDPYAKLKEGTGYVAIGDSFTRGYGASDHWQDQIYRSDAYGDFNCRNVDGAYPKRVADHFGLYSPDDIRDTDARMWPICHDAVSTAYMLDLLGIDDGFRDDELTYNDGKLISRYQADLQYFGDPLSLTLDGQSTYGQTGEVMSIRELLKNASLITLEVGQTDVIYKAQIFGLNKMDLSDVSGIPAGVANIVKLLYRYFDYWKDAYPLLLDFIKENTPDAEVILVGTLNPIKDATISDNFALPIGNAINIIMDTMNAMTRKYALQYGYTFVDISDVETPAAATTMSIGHILSIPDPIEYGLIAHPTPKGYEQIAERVIKAIEKDLNQDSAMGKIKAFFAAIIEWFKSLFAKITGAFSGIGG